MSASASVARTSGVSEARTLAPVRNPDLVDRSRGTGTGGVTADRIGFSKEISLPQRRQIERQSGSQGAAYSVSSAAPRGAIPADATYGRDGRLVGTAAPADSAAIGRLPNQNGRTAQATAPTSTTINSGATTSPDTRLRETMSPATGLLQATSGRRDLADQRVPERTDKESQIVVQRETQVQQRTARVDAAENLAQRLGEAQNTERPTPAQGQNDVARQRLERAYQPAPMAAAAKLSVFA